MEINDISLRYFQLFIK